MFLDNPFYCFERRKTIYFLWKPEQFIIINVYVYFIVIMFNIYLILFVLCFNSSFHSLSDIATYA